MPHTHHFPEPLPPERIHDLQVRAGRVHPDEPVASAAEVLALIGSVQTLGGSALDLGHKVGQVRAQAEDWIASRDLQIAAAGRIMLALIDGRAGALTGLI